MAIKLATSTLQGRETSTYRIDKFNGVDYTTTPTQVDDTRAIDISNYVPLGNSLAKRYGIKEINKDFGQFYNIWPFEGGYVVHKTEPLAGPTYVSTLWFYSFLEDNSFLHGNESYRPPYKICDMGSEGIYGSTHQMRIEKSFGIQRSNRLFVFSYNYENNVFVLRKDISTGNVVCDLLKDIAYIPTHILGIDKENGTALSSVFEELNIASDYYYVELIAYQGENKPNDTSVGYTFYDLTKYGISLNDIVAINGVTEEIEPTYQNGVLSGPLPTFNKIILTKKLIIFDTLEPQKNANGISYHVVKVRNTKTNPSLVAEMNIGCVYGSYGYRDRLFLTGNPDYPNLDIHSLETNDKENEWLDFTYFGDSSYQLFGGSESAIIGYGILNNGQMAIFKESSLNQPNLYLRRAEMQTITDSFGNTVAKEIFPVTISGLNIDCTKESKIISFGNDLIVSNPSGIYQLYLDSSTATQSYKTKELSYFIRNNLSQDISVNNLIVRDNLLYVVRKDINNTVRVYVADSNRYSFNNGLQTYEWWVLDYYHATNAIYLNNQFYVLAESKLFMETKEFFDEQIFKANRIHVGNEVISSEVFIYAPTDMIYIATYSGYITRIKNSLNVKKAYEQFKEHSVILFRVNNGGLVEAKIIELYYQPENSETLYPISDCTLGDDDIWYYISGSSDNTVRLGTKQNVTFNIMTLSENYTDKYDFEESMVVNEFVIKETIPIETYWYSKHNNLGTISYLKSIDRITFVPEFNRGGLTNVGFRANRKNVSFESASPKTTFDFNYLEFDNFSFGGNGVSVTYSSKRKIKHFSFIQFIIDSNTISDSTITEFSVRYYISKNNKGVK